MLGYFKRYFMKSDLFLYKNESESKEFFAGLVEKAGIGITITDMEGKFQYCNTSFREITGYSDDELMLMKFSDLLHPDDFEIAMSLHDERLKGVKVQSQYSFRMLSKGGEIIHWDVNSASLIEGNTITGTRSYYQDITKRKWAEYQWHKTKQKLGLRLRYEEAIGSCSRELLSNRPDAINESLQHLLIATQVSRVYIYENIYDENVGMCISIRHEACARGTKEELNNPDLQSYSYKNGLLRWQILMAKGELVFGDVKDFPDGERELLEKENIKSILSLPIWVNGEWYGFIGFNDQVNFRDWSEEINLLQTSADLIGAYIERQQSQEILRKSKEEAEKMSEMKSHFLANVSHEIRTPMNGIIGFSEIILNSDSIDIAKAKAQAIINESESLLMLINEILDHTKMEAGKTELEYRPLNFYKFLDDITELGTTQASAKGLEFIFDLDEKTPKYLICDSLRLRQVIMNLLSNSIKFTSQGSITLRILTQTYDENKAALKISVIDTGIGISKDKQATIFESYTQEDGSTTRKYGGTGLGTTISKQLVELMGGEIGIFSEQGEGAEFWFTVEFEISGEVADQADELQVDEDIQALMSNKRKEKSTYILLVEDYPPNQEVAKMHLEAAGHNVTIVDNGKKAVDICREKSFDMILMDIQMPVMDGFEASFQIRSSSKCSFAPIVALTANADAGTRQNCLMKGINDLITKPIRRKILLNTVDKWLYLMSDGPKFSEEEPIVVAEENQEVKADDNTQRPLNLENALEEFGSMELIEDVSTHFVENVELQIPIIQDAINNNDCERIRREAHSIKGGSATLEAHPLSETAKVIESYAKEGNINDIPLAFNKFISEFKRLKDFIEKLF